METGSRPTNQPTYGSDQPDYLKYLARQTGEGLPLLKSVWRKRKGGSDSFFKCTTIMQDYKKYEESRNRTPNKRTE